MRLRRSWPGGCGRRCGRRTAKTPLSWPAPGWPWRAGRRGDRRRAVHRRGGHHSGGDGAARAAALRLQAETVLGPWLADRGFAFQGYRDDRGLGADSGAVRAERHPAAGRRNRTAGRFSSRCGSGGRTGTRSCPPAGDGAAGSVALPGAAGLPLEETNGLCVEWNGLRFAVRAAQPVCVGRRRCTGGPCWRWRTERRRQSRREGKTLGFSGGAGADGGVPETAGVDAVCAYPEERRRQRSGPVAAVSLRACQGGPGGFRDYLGERYDESTGQWQELYGRRVTLTFGLDLYGESAGELQTAYDRMAEAFQWEGPAGLALRELSCGETEFDRAAGLYRRAVTAVCQGYLYAVADEGGTFLDFVVRGHL